MREARILFRRVGVPTLAREAFETLFVDQDSVWLDSSPREGSADERARWSVLAGSDGPWSGRLEQVRGTVSWTGTAAHRRMFDGVDTSGDPHVLRSLDRFLSASRVETASIDAPFQLGWVGFVGYEALEPTARSAGVDAHLLFADRALVIDHLEGTAWLLALTASGDHPIESEARARNARWIDESAWSLAELRRADSARPAPPTPALAPAEPALAALAPVSREEYERRVQRSRERIRDGDAFQVCLTTAFTLPALHIDGDELDVYERLRAVEPVPFGAFLALGDTLVLSRSPERFLSVSSEGRMLAEPIKGTRRRVSDPVEDDAVRRSLARDEKERAENLMIVDLMRNDLTRSAIAGSVRVERLCDVESYASVHQLVSSISAELGSGARGAAVAAAFPPGSMTGAPKSSGTRIARDLEDAPRGVYSGVIGYFSVTGAVDLSVVIRSLVGRGPHGARRWSYGAGGAVVWPSSPEAEADEVLAKSRSILAAVGHRAAWETEG